MLGWMIETGIRLSGVMRNWCFVRRASADLLLEGTDLGCRERRVAERARGRVVLPKIVETGRMGSVIMDQHVGVLFNRSISREEDHPQEEEKGEKG